MIMITIVICLALEFFTANMTRYRSLNWFGSYAVKIRKLFGESEYWKGPWGVLAIMVGPLFLVAIIQRGLANIWLGLFELLFGILVLLYCLRFQSMDHKVDEFIEAMEGNETERAAHLCENIIPPQEDIDERLVETCTDGVLVQSNERLFSVIFWFAFLGPLGALLYRLSWYLSEEQKQEPLQDGQFHFFARRLYGILSWVPARILIVSFAVVGSFEEAVHGWRQVPEDDEDDWQRRTEKLVYHAGAGAMHMDRYRVPAEGEAEEGKLELEAVRVSRALVLRTLLAWGIVIAVITLIGWLS